MLVSALFGKTLRQPPAEAESANHQLMLRACLIQQTAAGIYSFMPLGYRALRRIEEVIRQEMDAAGGQEVHMPVLSPAELWEESGRLKTMGDILMSLQDRRERTLILGPTHEEVVTDLVRRNVQSYRDLPLLIYQIQTKFRDEARPRGGLLRGREFLMKDLYSFDQNWEGLDVSYDKMVVAYQRVFDRCGVPARPAQADSGAIGGKDSQEFLFLTDIGEDEVLICTRCNYAANAEKATLRKPLAVAEELLPIGVVETPGTRTIDDLTAFMSIPAERTLKAVLMLADKQPVFVAMRGDMQLNEIKLRNAIHAQDLVPMDEATAAAHGIVPGFAGPTGLSGVRILADDAATTSPNLVTGANKPDRHLKNVNYGRDWQANIVTDLALAREGNPCPNCATPLTVRSGIELGHVFKLGTIYSEAMGANFLDGAGSERPCIMGCYGIGVSRLLAAVVEANHDNGGIAWPVELAPYPVHIVALNTDRPEIRQAADALNETLKAVGLEPLYDDREESAGVKFKDADLLGMPVRLTVSPRNLQNGAVELKVRASGATELVPFDAAVERVRAGLAGLSGAPA